MPLNLEDCPDRPIDPKCPSIVASLIHPKPAQKTRFRELAARGVGGNG